MKQEKHLDPERISLQKATSQDKEMVVDFDFNLDEVEHIKLNREAQISTAISRNECFLITLNQQAIGFVLFDYRFFGQGWIELLVIDEEYRGQGIAGSVFDLLCEQCQKEKVFTSTNRSNTRMQKALTKAGFSFAGELQGLDDGDPERFYFKQLD